MHEDREWVTALARGLRILGAFSASEPALTVSQLVERTGLPKATVSRLSYTLSELGFLRRAPNARAYTPGAAILALAYPMLATLNIRQIAQPMMRELSDETQSSVSLSLLDRDRLVYVETCRPPNCPDDHRPDIGVIWPLTSGAPGQAFVVGLPEPERIRLLNILRVQDPDGWAVFVARIEASGDEYRRLGFCTSYGEIRPDIYGVAVPVRFPIMGHRFAFNCAVAATSDTKAKLTASIGPSLQIMVDRVERALRASDRKRTL